LYRGDAPEATPGCLCFLDSWFFLFMQKALGGCAESRLLMAPPLAVRLDGIFPVCVSS